MIQDAHNATLWEHVDQLRKTVIQALVVILAASALCLWNYQALFAILTYPLEHPKELVLFSPIDGMSIAFKLSFWTGLVISSPFWVYFFLRFAAPAFHVEEWRKILIFIALSVIFLAFGTAFAYRVTIPLANRYFETFNDAIGTNLWSLSQYLDYTLFLVLANGLAFELSLTLFFLVHFGIVSAKALKDKRRYMILFAFILGAILTPPDVTSQLMLALPLAGLYELAILYAILRERVKNYLGIRT